MKFRPGDRVKWTDQDGEVYTGEVTIPGEDNSKVIFDGNPNDCEGWFPDYDYYPNDGLELIGDDE